MLKSSILSWLLSIQLHKIDHQLDAEVVAVDTRKIPVRDSYIVSIDDPETPIAQADFGSEPEGTRLGAVVRDEVENALDLWITGLSKIT